MPGLKKSPSAGGAVSVLPTRPALSASRTTRTTLFMGSELESDGEFRLPRRRVDVRQQRGHGTEQRPAGRRVVARADVVAGDVEVRAVEDVEQLRDELRSRGADAEELREAQVDVGEPGTIDLRDRRQVPRRPERVDGIEIQRTAARHRHDAGWQIGERRRRGARPRNRVVVEIESRRDRTERQARAKIADRGQVRSTGTRYA